MPPESSGNARMTIAQVNALERGAFVSAFGDVFEHSPWVAERAWDARPFASREGLFDALAFVLRRAECAAKLALIRAHPDLAGKAARKDPLTHFSGREQAGAGLDALTGEESRRLESLNQQYKAKFGFPCIVAVKGLGKAQILELFAARLGSSADAEYAENLKQIRQIARFRLAELVDQE